MSKSIKDYKDAMDSVKISDSFYKRTEVLLSESSEIEVVRSSPSKMKIIIHATMAAAACLLVAFGVKTVIDNRTEADSAVITEFGQETTVVTIPVTVPETASPVIDRPEDGDFLNDSGVLVGDMPEIPDVDDEAAEEHVVARPTVENISEDDIDIDTVAVIETEEEAAPKAPDETTVTTSAREGYPEMAEPQGAENIPSLSDAATDEVSVRITPYFDLGAIKSGENPVSGYGSDYRELISTLYEITNESTAIENESFKSVFLIQISEQHSEITYYSIYVTDASTLVVTRHDVADQKRSTYQLSADSYNKILLLLYSDFGDENKFDYFLKNEIGIR